MQKQIVLTEIDVSDIRKTLFEARMLLENNDGEENKEKILYSLKHWQELLKF